jgi:formate hydrogenlyase subunit 3/multisubunit Na+/H+ antiporter MnhD subunit
MENLFEGAGIFIALNFFLYLFALLSIPLFGISLVYSIISKRKINFKKLAFWLMALILGVFIYIFIN